MTEASLWTPPRTVALLDPEPPLLRLRELDALLERAV
jgi:hypothetical protein